MKHFKAIAFDKDGTIFDSERIYAQAFRAACAHFGLSVGEHLRDQMTGLAAEASVAFLQDYWGSDFDAQAFIHFWRGEHRRIIDTQGLPLMPHIDEVLVSAYEAGYPLALVTSDSDDGTFCDFADYGHLFALFSVVITIDHVAAAKPDADPYLRAAALLGVAADELLVIEDSRVGALSALNAQAQLVYYPSSSSPDSEIAARACRVIADPAEVLPWLH